MRTDDYQISRPRLRFLQDGVSRISSGRLELDFPLREQLPQAIVTRFRHSLGGPNALDPFGRKIRLDHPPASQSLAGWPFDRRQHNCFGLVRQPGPTQIIYGYIGMIRAIVPDDNLHRPSSQSFHFFVCTSATACTPVAVEMQDLAQISYQEVKYASC